MYEALLDRSLRSLDAVKRHLAASSEIRALISQRKFACTRADVECFHLTTFYEKAPNPTEWRIIDHCSAVTRLYAIYEQFVQELLREFLVFLEKNIAYADLDVAFRSEHRRLLGQLLVHLDRERYRSLSLDAVITDLAGAFSSSGKYKLLPEAMLAHDQNLRLPELVSLLSRCGLQNSQEWLNKHRAIRGFFSDQARQSEKVESELKQLVDYRNDASHGGIEIDSVLGPEILIEYADFLTAMFKSLTECVQWWILEHLLAHNRISLAGKVSEVFRDNVIVAIVENAKFSVGDRVYLRGENYCYAAKIQSIQNQGADVPDQTVLTPIELGFRLDVETRRFAELYCVPSVEVLRGGVAGPAKIEETVVQT